MGWSLLIRKQQQQQNACQFQASPHGMSHPFLRMGPWGSGRVAAVISGFHMVCTQSRAFLGCMVLAPSHVSWKEIEGCLSPHLGCCCFSELKQQAIVKHLYTNWFWRAGCGLQELALFPDRKTSAKQMVQFSLLKQITHVDAKHHFHLKGSKSSFLCQIRDHDPRAWIPTPNLLPKKKKFKS